VRARHLNRKSRLKLENPSSERKNHMAPKKRSKSNPARGKKVGAKKLHKITTLRRHFPPVPV
jgi:hypothetical protein